MEAIIFIGIPATGKSSFYKEHFFKTHVRISLDMLKTRHRENLLLQACIQMQQPFVVDNTNSTITERAKYIAPAKAAEFRVVGYYFQSKIEDAIQRNNERNKSERVPEKGIRGIYNRLQIPTLLERFDELHYVKTGTNKDFIIEVWSDEV